MPNFGMGIVFMNEKKAKPMKILFILKSRFYNNMHVKSYGLVNSASHVARYLETIGCETKIVTVIDGNFIDKEIFEFKPDVVIIEALWVTGAKMKELMEIKRYKKIKWIVRVHSDIGYLSAETYALKYINDYIALDNPNLMIAPNNKDLVEYLSNALHINFEYLPNIIQYKQHQHHHRVDNQPNVMNVGCFGALRILKNQVFQALCAIKAADNLGKTLYFHVTVVRGKEDNSKKINPVLENLEELFVRSKHHLIIHDWKENDEFQHLIKKMDIGLQLSYTESFNIVTADFISNNIPILVSDAINWMPNMLRTSTTDYDKVVKDIIYLYNHRDSERLIRKMHESLYEHNMHAKRVWLDFIREIHNPRDFHRH